MKRKCLTFSVFHITVNSCFYKLSYYYLSYLIWCTRFRFVLFNDTWPQWGHSVSCMTILLIFACESQEQASSSKYNGFSTWWLPIATLIFLRGLCGYVWVNILKLLWYLYYARSKVSIKQPSLYWPCGLHSSAWSLFWPGKTVTYDLFPL